MRVLGIDPGLRLTGYACLDDATSIVEAGVFRLARADGDLSARLEELDRDFRAALERLRPEVVAIEALFAHYKHPATAIVMGHGRGVLLLAVKTAGLELVEFKPAEVKKAMTGSGAATKVQMQEAVQHAFGLAEPPSPPDVADAIAIARCAHNRLCVLRGVERVSNRRSGGRS